VESRQPGSSRARGRSRGAVGQGLPGAPGRRWRAAPALLALAAWTGCTYTVAGDYPQAIEPPPPSFQPSVEHTVADFKFALGAGEMATSIFDGRQLSDEIMRSWQKRGYVRSEESVDDGEFSGSADYQLTLHGGQRGETGWTMQIINALTLSLVPYTITQRYEFEYVLVDVRKGARYTAAVSATDKTWVQGLLVLALPFHGRGHRTTMERVGDKLYDQFRRQGAFSPPEEPPKDVQTEARAQ
jgi:hypothetical protein